MIPNSSFSAGYKAANLPTSGSVPLRSKGSDASGPAGVVGQAKPDTPVPSVETAQAAITPEIMRSYVAMLPNITVVAPQGQLNSSAAINTSSDIDYNSPVVGPGLGKPSPKVPPPAPDFGGLGGAADVGQSVGLNGPNLFGD